MDVLRKDEKTLLNGISSIWIQVYGALKVLTIDRDRGMRGTEVDHWAIYNQITMMYKRRDRRHGWLKGTMKYCV